MKQILVGSLVTSFAICLLFAQGKIPDGRTWRKYTKPYDGKKQPPLSLTEAYQIAIIRMGKATNRFYCVSAGCLEKTRGGPPGWTIAFLNTNEQLVRIEVFFDKDMYVDTPSAALIEGK